MSKIPSPCIGDCAFARDRHCLRCSMTKTQKSVFKKLKKPAHRKALVELVVCQQNEMGGYSHWMSEYRLRCARKGIRSPV